MLGQLFIFTELEPYFYYFVVTKIPSWSNKWAEFPILLLKMVSILFSEPTGTFGLSKYEGDRVNPKLRVKCEWRSCLKTGFQTFFKWIHLSFTGPILQHDQRQIQDTGVAKNYIFSLIWRCYGPKRNILDYWGTIIFCSLSYYILSKYKGL